MTGTEKMVDPWEVDAGSQVLLEQLRYAIPLKMDRRAEIDVTVDMGSWMCSVWEPSVLRSVITVTMPVQPIEDISVRYPRTWWDAVKERFFPPWAKRHWPVSWEDHSIKVVAIMGKVKMADAVRGFVVMRDGVGWRTLSVPKAGDDR